MRILTALYVQRRNVGIESAVCTYIHTYMFALHVGSSCVANLILSKLEEAFKCSPINR